MLGGKLGPLPDVWGPLLLTPASHHFSPKAPFLGILPRPQLAGGPWTCSCPRVPWQPRRALGAFSESGGG